jgi:hypothetical protein
MVLQRMQPLTHQGFMVSLAKALSLFVLKMSPGVVIFWDR